MSPIKKAATFAGEDLMATIRPPSPEQLDHAVIRAIFGSLPQHKAARFHALMHSDEDGKAGSPSEADFALFCFLALGTRDEEQIERIARTSPRAREKWDKHRSYLTRSIDSALEQTHGEYLKRQATPSREDEASSDAPVVRSMADYIADPERLKPPAAVIPRLAWAGRVVMTAGASGTGKSTIYKAGCAAVTRGRDFLGAPTIANGGDVLWARLEESEYDLFVNGLQRFNPDPARLIAFRPGSAPLDDLVATIRSRPWAVTVVDSIHQLLQDCGVKDFNDAAQVGAVFAPLEQACRDTGTAMVWIGKANRAGEYRNSSEFRHTPDLVWEVARDKGSTQLKFESAKTRFDIFDFKAELVENKEYRVVLGAHTGTTSGRLSSEQRKVLHALTKALTWTQWLDAYGGNRNTFKDAIGGLAKRGLVVQDAERGTWVRVEFEAQQELAAA